MEKRVNGFGGCITVTKKGDIGVQFSTPRMPWAYVIDNVIHFGINPGEHYVEKIQNQY